MDKSARIYVAGHTGLLGSAILRKLKNEGYDNILTAPRAELDLCDKEKTWSFLKKKQPDYVFLCAAKVGGIQANIDSPADFLYENLTIQNNVISGAWQTGVRKLLFVGSTCIYPAQAPQPLKEEYLLTGPFEPTNEGYAIAKVTGVALCKFYRKQYGCDFITAIPTNLFGINDHYDLRNCHLLPALIAKIHLAKTKGEKTVELWGTGKPKREFMFADDCADALLFLMNRYSAAEHINVGTGRDASILELGQAVATLLDANVDFQFNTTKPDGMQRKLVDVSKINALGWKSKCSLEEGITKTYEDYLQRFG